jgi:DNA-binding PadR family transcriptional regulator
MTLWERRDLPVLRALATTDNEDVRQGYLHLSSEQERPLGLDLTTREVYDALLTLDDAGYIEGQFQRQGGGGAIVTHFQVTGRGQQALGEWPLFDQLASPGTLALLLERLAEEASSREEAGNLQRAARYAGGLTASTLRAASISALAHVARVGLGMG